MLTPKIYTIDGIPVPLKRPRFSAGHVWNSQKQLFMIYGICLKEQHNDLPLYEGPLSLSITFYFPKNKKQTNSYWHTFRPDLSNLIKLIEDTAQGVLYKEDCIISEIHAKKVYDNDTRTEFTITELK